MLADDEEDFLCLVVGVISTDTSPWKEALLRILGLDVENEVDIPRNHAMDVHPLPVHPTHPSLFLYNPVRAPTPTKFPCPTVFLG
jgi:hypothetical protein